MPMQLLYPMLVAALLIPVAAAQTDGSTTPQQDWMVHMDGSGGSWKYVPDRIVLVPGGLVQLMVFGNGQHSLTLDGSPAHDADISTTEGSIRTAEFQAPDAPGEYPFHDKYHPEARGVLVVARAQPPVRGEPSVIGVVPGGYESKFAPDRLEVAPGAEVVFRANGTFGHNLQSVEPGLFSAGDLAPGGEGRFRAPDAPGEYAFECRFHAEQGMRGVLVVREAEGAPAPTPATPEAAPATRADESARETPGPAILLVLAGVALALLVRAPRRPSA